MGSRIPGDYIVGDYILDSGVAQRPDSACLVRCRTLVALYINPATVSFPDMWLNRHNLFACLGFSQLYHLLLGQVAQVLESKPAFKSVFMASDWARCCATLPITGHTYSIAKDKWCQYIAGGRIGVWGKDCELSGKSCASPHGQFLSIWLLLRLFLTQFGIGCPRCLK